MNMTDETFRKVASTVGDKRTQYLRDPTREEKLKLYGLYKRATTKDTERGGRPGVFNVEGRMKYDAWVAEDSKSNEEAKVAYADLAKVLIGKEIDNIIAYNLLDDM